MHSATYVYMLSMQPAALPRTAVQRREERCQQQSYQQQWPLQAVVRALPLLPHTENCLISVNIIIVIIISAYLGTL